MEEEVRFLREKRKIEKANKKEEARNGDGVSQNEGKKFNMLIIGKYGKYLSVPYANIEEKSF
ncbi:hypothetical protein H5410_051613 [Solanum commersonii]|uniref:Uncharacterized protein n=1 Tax=Solanum commersonii TaxID=4109 RepID=A0A9J5WYY8_SOLCO|nr:hypothetical protein H5410_051613 [Solanum commersonii]